MTVDAAHGSPRSVDGSMGTTPAGSLAEPAVTAAQWSPTSPDNYEMPGAGATMRRVMVKAGHVAARHHHEFEQFLYVVSGKARLQCEQGTVPLEPGTALHLATGAWHSAEFMADTVLIEVNLDQQAS